jgi:ABC-type glycerol-3-phosphate transport system substrate-binding protein
MNPDTSEIELYALPLGNDSYAISKLGVTSKQSLVAFVPNYSKKKEESIELIKYLISGEKTKGVEERNND